MLNGYWGNIVRINLSNNSVNYEELDDFVYKKFLGGSGLGAYLIHREVHPEVKPFSSENKLIFSLGPFHGTKIPGGIKWSVVSKSPLTNAFADSAAGSSWGLKLKKAGYDALIIQGVSQKPSFLLIDEGQIIFKDASALWGKDTYKTHTILYKQYKSLNPSIACIGKAGENRVAIANIVVDKYSFVGRCGLGAIMGAKNLKAVIVCGNSNKKMKIADEKKLFSFTKELQRNIGEGNYAKATRKDGRANAIIPYEKMGNLPIRYWTGDTWSEGAKKIGAPAFTKVLKAKGVSCIYCPIACHRNVEIKYNEKILRVAGPEYETLGMLGSCLDIDNVKIIALANHMCNLYGIDTISLGAYVGFAVRCFEEGLISRKDYSKMKIGWGSNDFLISFIKQISEKKYLGSLFSNGLLAAAKQLGRSAEKIAVHVKNLDVPAYDPRAFFSMAINYATSNRGACHVRGFAMACAEGFILPEIGINESCDRFKMENKDYITAKYQDFCTLCNSIGLCNTMLIAGMNLNDITKCFNAITGWDYNVSDLMKAGERVFTLQRVINNSFGFDKKDDILPDIFFKPANSGGRAGKIPEPFKKTLEKYYLTRGWDQTGKPTKEKLIELGLEKI